MTDLDNQVQSFVQKLEERKARYQNELSSVNQPWKTNCVLKIMPVGTTTEGPKVNLMTCRDMDILVEAYAWVISREASMNQAAVSLGIEKTYTYYLGYSYADWKTDIQKRVKQLVLEEEALKIKELEYKVEAVLSENQKRALQIAQLTQIFE